MKNAAAIGISKNPYIIGNIESKYGLDAMYATLNISKIKSNAMNKPKNVTPHLNEKQNMNLRSSLYSYLLLLVLDLSFGSFSGSFAIKFAFSSSFIFKYN